MLQYWYMSDESIESEKFNENPDQVWLSDENAVDDLNVAWREVIEGLMSGLPMYKAYAKAYDFDTEDIRQRKVAESNGSRLLRNAKFRKVFRRVIEERGFNDEIVDWRLADIINNPATADKDRIKAIKHYNEMTGRAVRRTDITSNGETVAPIILSEIKPRNAVSEAEAATSN